MDKNFVPQQITIRTGIDNQLALREIRKRLNYVPDYQQPAFLTSNLIGSGPYITEGHGVWLTTYEGRRILDFSSMTVNCSLGQNDPWLKLCLQAYDQSHMPTFLSSRFKSPLYCSYPERLAKLNIGGIQNPRINHRQCNGSDVTELAIKAASVRAGSRQRVISLIGGYHGQNLTSYLVSDKQKHLGFLAQKADVCFVPAPNHAENLEGSLSVYDRACLGKIKELLPDSFALILEPVQMNNGVNALSYPFLREVRKLCDEYDVCLIFDEVQTGFGWHGALTAADASGVTPDILCLAKGLTAGYGPLALMVCNEKYADLPYGCGEKTNGADLRSLVAAHAVLDRLVGVQDRSVLQYLPPTLVSQLSRGLLPDVKAKALLLGEFLQDLKNRHPRLVRAIRQCGLAAGIDLDVTSEGMDQIMVDTLFQGLFIRKSGTSLIVKPALVTNEREMELGFSVLDRVLSGLGDHGQ
jgi:4-aminobutyrate aminotransferase-like enzyme